jgi:phosphatidylethanolamine-binding protein (PEBP) family uncharacterized protein
MRRHSAWLQPLVLGAVVLASCDGSTGSAASTTSPTSPGAPTVPMTLTSPVATNGGTLPAEYTCDGAGATIELAWGSVPAGTREFALLMSTLPGDGTTKWNWVIYGIPATATGLTKNSSGVGVLGVGSDGPTAAYQPPCSHGPGPKTYTFTVYALSASPVLPASPFQVTGAVLMSAIAPVTLGSASLSLTYSRPR